jgi:hypothetical protein
MDWTSVVIGLVGGFILSIIANYFTDPIKDWFSKRSLISKYKRVNQLKHDLERMTKYYQNKEKFYFHLIQNSFVIYSYIFFIILFIVFIISIPSLKYFDNLIQNISLFWFVSPAILTNSNIVIILFMSVFFTISAHLHMLRVLKEINFIKNYNENKASIEKRISDLSGSIEPDSEVHKI